MREIKFRAYNTETSKMIFLDPFQWPLCALNEEKGWKVMQYTGLHDKNSKEVYEGDIVRAFIDYGPAGAKRQVYSIKITPWGCGLEKWTYDEPDVLPEVIGNIYENPELLKLGPSHNEVE